MLSDDDAWWFSRVGAADVKWNVECAASTRNPNSASFLAEISVSSPRKLFIFII